MGKYPFLSSKMEQEPAYPAHIIDNIYLSSYLCAQNKTLLERMKIENILNVSDDCDNLFEDKIKYKRIKISDSHTSDIHKHFDETFQWIEKSNGKILVHCYQGISRSSTIVISVRLIHN